MSKKQSKIEQTIAQLEELSANAKFFLLSNTKIVVDKAELDDIIAELRERVPEDIKKYQALLNDKDKMMADAQKQAQSIIDTAATQSAQIINNHEITHRAQSEGNEYVNNARNEAQQIIDEALAAAADYKMQVDVYLDDMMASIQQMLQDSMENTNKNITAFMEGLNGTYAQIVENRNAMAQSVEEYAKQQATEETTENTEPEQK